MAESLRIVVPSRHRADNLPRLAQLLPGCTVFVHESERAAYEAQACGQVEIATHAITNGIGPIRNAVLDVFDEDCIVMIDDDLMGVVPLLAKRQRRVTDPRIIRQVIESGHHAAADLNLGVFCWSRDSNPIGRDNVGNPVRLLAPIANSFGIRGPARRRRFDAGLRIGEDFDFTMQTLLHDRVVLCDCRWYFDHGPVYSGTGGTSGTYRDEDVAAVAGRLRERWGRWIPPHRTERERQMAETGLMLRMDVPRRNPSAVRL